MTTLAPPETAFDHENAFYLSCSVQRIGKLIAQYELFKRIVNLPGAIVECGVFKGASLARLAMFREMLSTSYAHQIVAFDTFDRYAWADTPRDVDLRAAVVEAAGADAIPKVALQAALSLKWCGENVEFVAGDILETVPAFAQARPELRIALLNLDVDFYEPSRVVLEHLWPRVVPGGILMLDDYGTFEGETLAAEEFFGARLKIQKFGYAYSPSFVVKE